MSDGKGNMMPVKQDEESYDKLMAMETEKVALGEDMAGIHRDVEPVTIEVMKGEVQPPAFRDWFFAVLFLIQVAAVAGTAIVFAPALFNGGVSDDDQDSNGSSGANNQGDDVFNDDKNDSSSSSSDGMSWSDFALFLVGTFMAASLLTMSAFRLMIRYPLTAIKVSFFVAPGSFAFVALLILVVSKPTEDDPNGDVHGSIVGFWWILAAVVSLFSLCFYYCYKRFMPFAAVNLKVALTAVRANMGLFFLSGGTLVSLWAWSFLWLFAVGGVIYHDKQKPQVPCSQEYGDDYNSNGGMCDQQPSAAALVALLLCLYWTQQVIQNTLHTTTAGAVSAWWILPEQLERNGGRGCCGQDVSDALYRSCTYSFGSICFGSLLVAILQTLEQIARQTRNRRDIVSCVIQCIVMCLRAYLEYFNSWAFCYVGIYGYDYLSAGRKVIDLFKARGWTTLITDRLVFRVLLLANLGISALTGAVCVLIMVFIGYNRIPNADAWDAAMNGAFWFGFIIGLIVSNTVLYVVESAVRTIIVCFAEQPGEGGGGSEALLQEFRETYATTHPELMVFQRTGTQANYVV
ncbi:hypothetical protein ACA910_007240 [Epithemia clementina (nom. ined.)]